MTANDDIFGSTTDYSHSIDEENLKRFIDDPNVKQDYFGNKKSSINRLGEYNLAKGKVKNGEFVWQSILGGNVSNNC